MLRRHALGKGNGTGHAKVWAHSELASRTIPVNKGYSKPRQEQPHARVLVWNLAKHECHVKGAAMKTMIPSARYLMILIVTATSNLTAAPLGTAFTYQRLLNDGANPANGLYEMQFSLYDA